MNDLNDQQLLREYAEHRSEAAFTELVRRHIDLVHSAAFRMTGEDHAAKDVTQTTFLALAQNAAPLSRHPVLSGWLHTTARNLAAKTVRAAVRRQNHEQEAAAMSELLSTAPEGTWDVVAPHLDAALAELTETDRDAVLLRYFEKKSAPEIARVLGTSSEAAQKRVSRAVERLREFFARRGVTVGSGGLVAVISANAVQAAPAGLVATVSTAALAGTTLSTATIVAATTKTLAMTTIQKTLITATVAAFAGAGIYEARQAAQLRNEVQTLQELNEEQRAETETLSNRLAALAETKTPPARSLPDAQFHELLRLRGEVGLLRKQSESLAKMRSQQQPASRSYEPSTSWTDAGNATPEDAASTFAWAIRNGTMEKLAEVLEFESDQGVTNSSALAEEFGRGLQPLMAGIVESRVLVMDDTTPDEVTYWYQSRFADGQTLVSPLTLKRVGNTWKVKLVVGGTTTGIQAGN